MIRRPLTVAATVFAMALLGAPSAMASTHTGGGATAGGSAAASCTGALAVSVGPTAVTVTGTVRCTADAGLDLGTSAQVGPVAINAHSAVQAAADTNVAINATVPVAGCTKASAILVNTATGVTIAAAAG